MAIIWIIVAIIIVVGLFAFALCHAAGMAEDAAMQDALMHEWENRHKQTAEEADFTDTGGHRK